MLESYLRERDVFRMNRGKPAYWTGTSMALAAKCHNQPDTWWEAAKLTKSTYDKYMHGRNRAKSAKNEDEEQELRRCAICGGNDSQAHQMVECSHDSFKDIRLLAYAQQLQIQQQYDRGQGGRSVPSIWVRETGAALIRLCQTISTQEVERLWLGTWTLQTLRTLCPVIITSERIGQRERSAFIRYIAALTTPLFKAQQELTRARMQMLKQADHGQPTSQPEALIRTTRRLKQSFLTNGFIRSRRVTIRKIRQRHTWHEPEASSQRQLTDCPTWGVEANDDEAAGEEGVIQVPSHSPRRSRILCSQLKPWKNRRKRLPLRRPAKPKAPLPRESSSSDLHHQVDTCPVRMAQEAVTSHNALLTDSGSQTDIGGVP